MINYEKNLLEAKNLVVSIELAKDPLSKGNLNYFNEMFQVIQACRDKILNLIIEAIWNKAKIQTELALLQTEYNSKLSQILSRSDVSELKSDKLRMAVADKELAVELSSLTTKERESALADAYYKSLVIIYDELKDKNKNLEQQFLTVRAMLNLDPSMPKIMIGSPQETNQNI